MFENPDFQVDEESEEFRLLNPLVSRISEKRKKKLRLLEQQEKPKTVSTPATRAVSTGHAQCRPVPPPPPPPSPR